MLFDVCCLFVLVLLVCYLIFFCACSRMHWYPDMNTIAWVKITWTEQQNALHSCSPWTRSKRYWLPVTESVLKRESFSSKLFQINSSAACVESFPARNHDRSKWQQPLDFSTISGPVEGHWERAGHLWRVVTFRASLQTFRRLIKCLHKIVEMLCTRKKPLMAVVLICPRCSLWSVALTCCHRFKLVRMFANIVAH